MADALAEGRKLLAEHKASLFPLVTANATFSDEANVEWTDWLLAHGEALLDCAEAARDYRDEIHSGHMRAATCMRFDRAVAALNLGDARDHADARPPEGETQE